VSSPIPAPQRASQLAVPPEARAVLALIPTEFVDDGCSNSPDRWFRFNFRWACRVHDWRYCTRCHPPYEMTQDGRHFADEELATNIRMSLPWRWRWLRFVYEFAVYRYGGVEAWNSCGYRRGERCRHNMTLPPWLMAPESLPDGA